MLNQACLDFRKSNLSYKYEEILICYQQHVKYNQICIDYTQIEPLMITAFWRTSNSLLESSPMITSPYAIGGTSRAFTNISLVFTGKSLNEFQRQRSPK